MPFLNMYNSNPSVKTDLNVQYSSSKLNEDKDAKAQDLAEPCLSPGTQ